MKKNQNQNQNQNQKEHNYVLKEKENAVVGPKRAQSNKRTKLVKTHTWPCVRYGHTHTHLEF